MTDWFIESLRQHSEVTFFLTLAIGYLLGKLRFRGFALGAVTGTLLAGVLIGQLGVKVSPEVKQCFFVLFLFSIGYRCGPQFFQGLRKDGLSQAALSSIIAVTGLATACIVARIFHYDPGTAGGVIAGTLTESATIGTTGDAITRLDIADAARAVMTNHIPVAFAVTYLIGVVGAAWFLSQIAPRLMGVDLAKGCAEYEARMGGGGHAQPGIFSAYRRIELRAYRIPEGSVVIGRPVKEILPAESFFVERVRRDGQIIEASADTVLRAGDIAAISGRRGVLVQQVEPLLSEIDDPELLDVPAERVDVFVTNTHVDGETLDNLAEEPFARGVFLHRVLRNKIEMPLTWELTVQRGDILTVVGTHQHVEAAVRAIGVADRPEETTDMVSVAAGIVIGALIGIPALAWENWSLGFRSVSGCCLAAFSGVGFTRANQ